MTTENELTAKFHLIWEILKIFNTDIYIPSNSSNSIMGNLGNSYAS